MLKRQKQVGNVHGLVKLSLLNELEDFRDRYKLGDDRFGTLKVRCANPMRLIRQEKVYLIGMRGRIGRKNANPGNVIRGAAGFLQQLAAGRLQGRFARNVDATTGQLRPDALMAMPILVIDQQSHLRIESRDLHPVRVLEDIIGRYGVPRVRFAFISANSQPLVID